METQRRIKPVKRIDVKATLLALGIGDQVLIKFREVNSSTFKSTISRINKAYPACAFEYTERGRIDGFLVTRLR